MNFNNLNDLFKKIEKDIQDTMTNEVANVTKGKMITAIETAVYDKYTPLHYDRRKENGGLSDINNISAIPIDNGIMLTNNAPLDNGNTEYSLDDIIVNRGVLGYQQGRDFYYEATNNLKQDSDLKAALIKGLKRKGYDIK